MAPSFSRSGSDMSDIIAEILRQMISLKGSNFKVNGHIILSDVPSNVAFTRPRYTVPRTGAAAAGCFVGFDADKPSSRHVVPIGKLEGIAFMSIFRFKLWWTTHRMGSRGRDMENETQMVILQKSDAGRPYVLLLPLLEGSFRASLQPGDGDNLDVCVESGSTQVTRDSFRRVLYMHASDDPYSLVKEGMKVVARRHRGGFRLLEDKALPGIVEKFGWCTWDAFNHTVHPQGVWEGVKGLAEGGCPPGLVLLDDGWQSISHDNDDNLVEAGNSRRAVIEQMGSRPVSFRENNRFRDYQSPASDDKGMGAFVGDLKKTFPSVDYVYVWHAFCGYWGGLGPNVPGLPQIKVVAPKFTPSLQLTMKDLAVDKIVDNGVGLVPPDMVDQMYEGLHLHLASVGIDGVKVDVVHLLEMMCEEYGGRVELEKAYYEALTSSVRKHFKGNGVIVSMEQGNEFMFLGTEAISLGLAGDDFWCNGHSWLQGCHLVHCAYNSVWMGNFVQPDWDMFQSTHPCAEFHAASRAVSGGPIYVSDSVGHHDFPLLRSLVLPDGSILRCRYHALPTRDCLFQDPLKDGNTMLKIWNLNKYTGVIGAFNCQGGGGCCREARSNKSAGERSGPVTSKASPSDVEWKHSVEPISVEGVSVFAVYKFRERKLVLLEPSEAIEVSLEPFDFELMTVSPVRVMIRKSIQFAPIGLVNMLNSGGAVQSLAVDEEAGSVKVGVKGSGEMRVFASEMPRACLINGEEVEFEYKELMVVVQVPWPHPSGFSVIEYLF